MIRRNACKVEFKQQCVISERMPGNMLSLYSHFSKNATLNARIMIIYCVNTVTGLDNAEQLNIIPIIGNNDYVHRSV